MGFPSAQVGLGQLVPIIIIMIMIMIMIMIIVLIIIMIIIINNFINQFLKMHYNMSKKCVKSSVLLQNIIIIYPRLFLQRSYNIQYISFALPEIHD